jgi:hypothetical protein
MFISVKVAMHGTHTYFENMATQSAGLHQPRVFKILKKHVIQIIILDLYKNVQR